MNAQDNPKSAPSAGPALQPVAFGELPGEFAIRTSLKDTYLTARDGGRHSVDAVITAATTVGPNEKFKLTSFQPNFTTIRTLPGFFVSAVGGGGLGGSFDTTHILQTERTSVADDALFRLVGPTDPFGDFSIGTFNDHFLTALGGGGKTTGAFHTDATTVSSWERFRLSKCGDLGSGYTYAITQTVKIGSPRFRCLAARYGEAHGRGIGIDDYLLGGNNGFTLIRVVDGSFALQTSNGFNYVTADNGGGIASGVPLLITQTHIQAWETFKIVDQGDGTYTIQTISGFFLAFGPRGISTRISDPNAAPSIGYDAKFELMMIGLSKQSP